MFNYNTAGPGGGPIPRLDGSASPTDYPYGKAKNDDPPGSGNGTPLQIETAADPVQAMYACLVNAGVVPNGLSENVNTSDFLTALRNMFFSIGDMKYHYGDSSPSANWLICDGSVFSAVTYPELNVFLGGTTLPDFRGKVIVDLEAGQPIFDTIGEEGGDIAVTLSEAQMPAHVHPCHMDDDNSGRRFRTGGGQVAGDTDTESTGGGEAHTNLQPYKVALLLIKAK